MLKEMDCFNIPSPLQKLDLSEFGISNHEVWVKRDDLIHPIVSGNKWRKLKNNIEIFLASKKSHIVSMGGAFSNHLLSLSFICNKYNISNTLLVRGEKPKELNYILLSCLNYNTKLIYTERKQYSNESWVTDFVANNFQNCFFIPEGGANTLGVRGCAQIIDEIDEDFDEIYCEVGTGATLMGIANALKSHQKVIGIVVLKGADQIKKNLEIKHQDFSSNKTVFLNDYHLGGYAKNSSKLIDFMRLFYSKTGIKTDPIYSGKLFYGLINELLADKDKKPKKIIALHSGGLAGIKGFENRYKLSIFPD